MKKRWLWLVMVLLITVPIGAVVIGNIERAGFRPKVDARAVVLMDLNTGRILLSENGDIPLPPASMSKLMTELVILDDIKTGKKSWDDEVQISDTASGVSGIKIALKSGEFLTVRELFQSITVYSANDAAVALAEHFAGSEEAFVQKMNAKAKEIGMSSSTHFVNASGVESHTDNDQEWSSERETVMTAEDTAKLAAHLIKSHPDILSTSSKTQTKISGRNLYLSNTNWMLPSLGGPYSYEGTDGLKTGYTVNAGYCFTGTAEKQGSRLIAVVMGTESKEARFEETRKLFDYGFAKTLTWKERLDDWFQYSGIAAALSHDKLALSHDKLAV
ncbi:peptidase S11 D-alanyl-D-alanine carboxypeptidase 1 [Paenibacillus vortex V453]|uniref:Peptidase S11 D-alanyl-D-alanine carboxypeptidase 1 n=1 Tax=Paenibacillus vortex V453 TaxID=715225 RepID=A0A2R9T2K2_9BACL|nr:MULTISPECIES: D-alanyl-D-alanine carboxypeptidase family protein [Paenibacillus]EFU43905.1 peptidase S11 D-alanyl-D-alanine carboxypeptidase 1 [Paenibacillus vortex V453]MDH6673669.1 D-alanyl-D-alanine carboxypeptidase [Paenibacillus sp. LBL]